MPHDGQVEVVVHDLPGRVVRTLLRGDLPAGLHRVEWDGTDDNGIEAAAGVYLCRLAVARQSQSARIVKRR